MDIDEMARLLEELAYEMRDGTLHGAVEVAAKLGLQLKFKLEPINAPD